MLYPTELQAQNLQEWATVSKIENRPMESGVSTHSFRTEDEQRRATMSTRVGAFSGRGSSSGSSSRRRVGYLSRHDHCAGSNMALTKIPTSRGLDRDLDTLIFRGVSVKEMLGQPHDGAECVGPKAEPARLLWPLHANGINRSRKHPRPMSLSEGTSPANFFKTRLQRRGVSGGTTGRGSSCPPAAHRKAFSTGLTRDLSLSVPHIYQDYACRNQTRPCRLKIGIFSASPNKCWALPFFTNTRARVVGCAERLTSGNSSPSSCRKPAKTWRPGAA